MKKSSFQIFIFFIIFFARAHALGNRLKGGKRRGMAYNQASYQKFTKSGSNYKHFKKSVKILVITSLGQLSYVAICSPT